MPSYQTILYAKQRRGVFNAVKGNRGGEAEKHFD